MTRKKQKVLLIGWDGADWEHINPLMDEGLLPTLESLVNAGTIGNLATLQPVLSPMLWNSVATGKFADKHGIHGFVEPNPEHGGSRPFQSTSRKTKALWNIFSQNGLTSNVINWWASHPAEKIKGTVVSNLFNGVSFNPEKGFTIAPGTVHPAERENEYARLKFFAHEMNEQHILPFIPNAAKIDQEKDKRLSGFAKTFAEMMTTHSIATAVMESEPWDFMAVYYTGIDHFSHGFMDYHPPKLDRIKDEDFEMYQGVIKGAYQFHDMMLERLLQLAGEDTTIVLCSDHGFQSGEFRPMGTPREPAGPAVWHRQYGMLVMKGEGIKQDERIYGASLIDIGPTILQLFDLPIGNDMDGRPLIEAFEDPPTIQTIPSWDEVEGEHGMPEGESETSLAEAEELLKQFVALGYIDDQGDDKEKQAESAEIENHYNLARCLLWQNRNDEALPIFEDLVRRAAWETRFIVQLADAYYRADYLLQAKTLLDQAFDLENTNVNQAIIIYAKVNLALGDQKTGMKYLVIASQRTPRYPNIHVQIGEVFAKQRRWQDAETSYKKALKLHPEHARAFEGLAAVYIKTGRYQEAADSALDAVSLIHRLPKAHLALGIAMLKSEDFERSLLAFQTAARFGPKLVNVQRWLAIVNEKLGNRKAADQHRQRAELLIQSANVDRVQRSDRRDQLFDLPKFESEQARNERLIKERPSNNDPVKKSGKTFVVVSGLPRSGTSLMMQMVVAGGIEAITDGEREADIDNPKGYYEWEAIKKIAEQPELLDDDELDGKVVKVISMLLQKLPREHDYKVVFMMRPVREIVASQTKMIERLNTEGAAIDEGDLGRGLAGHRDSVLEWLKTADHMEMIKVGYSQMLEDPENGARQVAEFLGIDDGDRIAAMQGTVDPSLYRNRSQ